MLRFLSRWSVLLAMPFAMLAMSNAPAQASPVRFPATCQDVKTDLPHAPDGTYLLYSHGNLFTVYCHDMAGTPGEYISLVETGPNQNFSQYTVGGAAVGTNVRTAYTKLRVNPATLTVGIGDMTFATSTGSLTQGSNTVTSMLYGTAASCIGPGDTSGIGNIDLSHTAFRLAGTFAVGGFEAAGSADISSNGQVASLSGGGFCGEIAPSLYDPYNPTPGLYDLPLSCARNGVVRRSHQLCLHIPDAVALTEQVARHGSTTATTVRYAGRQLAELGRYGQVRS